MPVLRIFLIFFLLHISYGENLPIRFVNEIPVFERNRVDELPPVAPEHFSGPDHLEQLSKHCYSYQDEKYKYTLCPFSNVTQEEIQAWQEHYKGILGIWGEWVIEKNQFKALNFIEGSGCGFNRRRSIKISLKCGKVSKLFAIKEPEKCRYEGEFETPLVCGNNSMVVYPRLPSKLQKAWDDLYTESHMGLLTQKGYEIALNDIFISAGYCMSANAKADMINRNRRNSKDTKCQDKVDDLQLKVLQLEEKLKALNFTVNPP